MGDAHESNMIHIARIVCRAVTNVMLLDSRKVCIGYFWRNQTMAEKNALRLIHVGTRGICLKQRNSGGCRLHVITLAHSYLFSSTMSVLTEKLDRSAALRGDSVWIQKSAHDGVPLLSPLHALPAHPSLACSSGRHVVTMRLTSILPADTRRMERVCRGSGRGTWVQSRWC